MKEIPIAAAIAITVITTSGFFGFIYWAEPSTVSYIGPVYGNIQAKQATILPTVPGAINTAITQANIKQNICNPNWSTKSERPTSSYTTALKIKQLKALGWTDQKTGDYEEDHLISLELGGNPTDPNNLWPEKYAEPQGAHDKDKIENLLHSRVCAGTITLKEAQNEISTDWTKVK